MQFLDKARARRTRLQQTHKGGQGLDAGDDDLNNHLHRPLHDANTGGDERHGVHGAAATTRGLTLHTAIQHGR
jgi:hypothetical protein